MHEVIRTPPVTQIGDLERVPGTLKPEVIIHEMDDGNDGNLTNLGKKGLKLPATPESIDNMMQDAGAVQPYTAYSYTFRLDGLNG